MIKLVEWNFQIGWKIQLVNADSKGYYGQDSHTMVN